MWKYLRRFSDNHTYGDFHSTRVSPIFWKITKSSLIVDFTKARANILNPINPSWRSRRIRTWRSSHWEAFSKEDENDFGLHAIVFGRHCWIAATANHFVWNGINQMVCKYSGIRRRNLVWTCHCHCRRDWIEGYYFTKEHQSFIGSEHFGLLLCHGIDLYFLVWYPWILLSKLFWWGK